MPKLPSLLNPLLFTSIILCWSFTWFAGKFLVNASTMMPEILAAYRFLSAGVFLFALSFVIKLPIKATKHELKAFTIASFFGCSLNLFLFFYSYKYIISGLAAIMFSMVIIFNLIIGVFFGIKQTNFIKTLFLALFGILGLFFVVISHVGHQTFTVNTGIGIVLGLLATVSFSISSVYYQTRKNITLHPVVAFSYMCIIGGILCIIMGYIHAFFTEKTMSFAVYWNFKETLAFLYMAVFGTAVGYLCSFTLVRRIGSVKTGYTTLIIPVLSLITSYFFEDYKFGVLTFVGMALILISEYLSLKDDKIK